MAVKALTYELAVLKLSEYIDSKASHGTKKIIEVMNGLRAMPFTVAEDHADFVFVCDNFARYVEKGQVSSIGKNQFTTWWETCAFEEPEEVVDTQNDEAADIGEELVIDDALETPQEATQTMKTTSTEQQPTEELSAATEDVEALKAYIVQLEQRIKALEPYEHHVKALIALAQQD